MRRATILAAAAAGLLASCGGDDGNRAGAAAAAAQEPAGNAAAPADAAGDIDPPSTRPRRDYLVGRWTETGNCAEEAIEFRADGSFAFPWGEEGRWSLAGSRLAMLGNPQTIELEVVSPDEMRATKSGGTVRRWQRCR